MSLKRPNLMTESEKGSILPEVDSFEDPSESVRGRIQIGVHASIGAVSFYLDHDNFIFFLSSFV